MAGTYKPIEQRGSISDFVANAFEEISSLASECEEAASNFPNSDHPKATAFQEVADALQDIEAPDEPKDPLFEELITVVQMIKVKQKKSPMSRAQRLDNATTALREVASQLRDKASERQDKLDEAREGLKKNEDDHSEGAIALVQRTQDEEQELIDELNQYADSLEEAADNAEGVEFPGMYG